MLDITRITGKTLEDILNNIAPGHFPDTTREMSMEQIQTLGQELATMSPQSAFEAWCNWNGFLGWAATIADTLDTIRKAEVNRKWTVIYSAPWHDSPGGYMAHVSADSAEEALMAAIREEIIDEPTEDDRGKVEVILIAHGHIQSEEV